MMFKHKPEILELASSINRHRIGLVHKLAERDSLDDILKEARDVKELYHQLFQRFEEAYDDFLVSYHSIKKDSFEFSE